MSILQEFGQIRREIGEERYNQINQFLEANQQYDLSDVYYREEVWKESEEWMRNNGIEPAVKAKASEYNYVDIEALEGGSPADVGLDARLDENDLSSDEHRELEALRAFKSYFDDCMVGQGYDIANFHMNGELEPFDNFYDAAMDEYHKAVEKEQVTDIDFQNTVDTTAEIMIDNSKVNAMLAVSDDVLKNILERTSLLTDAKASFDEALHETDATFNLYVDIYPDGNVTLTACMESDDLGWTDAEVLLSNTEKDSLIKDVDRAGKERYGQSLEELLAEAVSEAKEASEPEKKSKSNKNKNDVER